MPVDMTVKAGHTQTRLTGLAIVCRIEFLLWKRRQQKAQAIQVHRRQEIFEQPVISKARAGCAFVSS